MNPFRLSEILTWGEDTRVDRLEVWQSVHNGEDVVTWYILFDVDGLIRVFEHLSHWINYTNGQGKTAYFEIQSYRYRQISNGLVIPSLNMISSNRVVREK